MSEVAVHCPHCRAAQPGRDPRKSEQDEDKTVRKIGADEAAALLAVHGVTGTPRRGIWSTFLLPSPRLAGTEWLIDVGLIVLTIPLVLGVFASVIVRNRRSSRHEYERGEVTGLFFEAVVIGLLGGVTLLLFGWWNDMFVPAAVVTAVGAAALFGRAFLRVRANRLALDT